MVAIRLFAKEAPTMKTLTLALFCLGSLAYSQDSQPGSDYLGTIPTNVWLLPEDYLVPKPVRLKSMWKPKLAETSYKFDLGGPQSPNHYSRYQSPEGFLPEVARLNLSVVQRDRRPINAGFKKGIKNAITEAGENTIRSFEADAYYQQYSPITPGGHTPQELNNYERARGIQGFYLPILRALTGSVSAQVLYWFPVPFKYKRKK
jgi:hypothetical protein